MKKLTALFKPLEKLITEHGSATILRDHLSLLRSQTTILEKENTELKTKNQILEIENKNLKAEITDLRREIDECQKNNKNLKQKLSQNAPPRKPSSGWIKGYK